MKKESRKAGIDTPVSVYPVSYTHLRLREELNTTDGTDRKGIGYGNIQ